MGRVWVEWGDDELVSFGIGQADAQGCFHQAAPRPYRALRKTLGLSVCAWVPCA
jgi:hypothetical protein